MTQTQTPSGKVPAKSSVAPIECIVKKQFYDDKMQLVAEGKTYFYYPQPDQPFPASVLQPVDPALAEDALADFAKFKAAKLADIRERRDRGLALKKLARA